MTTRVWVAVSVWLWAGCLEPGAGCVEGQQVACDCEGGSSGLQICDATGAYGACTCDANTWLDPDTGLTWENQEQLAYNLGQTDAEAYCRTLDLDGLTGWRVPTMTELRTLVRDCVLYQLPEGMCLYTHENATQTAWEECTLLDGAERRAGRCRSDDVGCHWPAELRGSCGSIFATVTRHDGEGAFGADDDPRPYFSFSGPYIEVPAHPATRGLRVRCVHD